MSFIYDILYDDAYPVNSDTYALSLIKDISIVHKSSLTTAYITDLIINSNEAVVSIRGMSFILSAKIQNPKKDTVYQLLCDSEDVSGTIVFKEIPLTETKAVNQNAIISSKCIKVANPVNNKNILGSTADTVYLDVTGSLEVNIEEDDTTSVVIVHPIQDIFINNDAINVTTGDTYGFTSINGVRPDNSGNINIDIEGYTILGADDSLYIHINDPAQLEGCNSTDISEKIKCSVKDGSSTPYPLDELVCTDAEPICKPEWENNENNN